MISTLSSQKSEVSVDQLNNTLIVDGIGGDHGTMKGSIHFRLLINVELDDECYSSTDRLIISKSTTVTIRIVISPSYINYENVNGDQIKFSEEI